MITLETCRLLLVYMWSVRVSLDFVNLPVCHTNIPLPPPLRHRSTDPQPFGTTRPCTFNLHERLDLCRDSLHPHPATDNLSTRSRSRSLGDNGRAPRLDAIAVISHAPLTLVRSWMLRNTCVCLNRSTPTVNFALAFVARTKSVPEC